MNVSSAEVQLVDGQREPERYGRHQELAPAGASRANGRETRTSATVVASVTPAPTAVLATTARNPRSAATTAASAASAAYRPATSAIAARPICRRAWNTVASDELARPSRKGTPAMRIATRTSGA